MTKTVCLDTARTPNYVVAHLHERLLGQTEPFGHFGLSRLKHPAITVRNVIARALAYFPGKLPAHLNLTNHKCDLYLF